MEDSKTESQAWKEFTQTSTTIELEPSTAETSGWFEFGKEPTSINLEPSKLETQAWANFGKSPKEITQAKRNVGYDSASDQEFKYFASLSSLGSLRDLNDMNPFRNPKYSGYRRKFLIFRGTAKSLQDWILHLNWKIWIVIDSIFRGISQGLFVNNSITGVFIFLGHLYVNPKEAFLNLYGVFCSTLWAYILNCNYFSIINGIYGFFPYFITNHIVRHFKEFSPFSWNLLIVIFFSGFLVVIIALTLGATITRHMNMPPLGLPFIFVTWFILLVARHPSKPYLLMFEPDKVPIPELIYVDNSQFQGIHYSEYSLSTFFVGSYTNISLFFWESNLVGSIFVLIGIGTSSPRTLLSFISGSCLSVAFLMLLGLPDETIRSAEYSVNGYFVYVAITAFFFVQRGYRVWIWGFASIVFVYYFSLLLEVSLFTSRLPLSGIPYSITLWTFIKSGELISGLINVPLASISTPEDHINRYTSAIMARKLAKIRSPKIVKTTKPSKGSLEKARDFNEIVDGSMDELPVIVNIICSKGIEEQLKPFLEIHTSFRISDYYGRTACHAACFSGEMGILDLLFHAEDIDFRSKDIHGITPIEMAIMQGNVEAADLLVENGILLGSFPSITPFMLNSLAAENSVKFLHWVKFGINTDIQDKLSTTPIQVAVIHGNVKLVKFLLENGSNPYHSDWNGRDSYDLAKLFNQMDVLDVLMDKHNITQVIREEGSILDNDKKHSTTLMTRPVKSKSGLFLKPPAVKAITQSAYPLSPRRRKDPPGLSSRIRKNPSEHKPKTAHRLFPKAPAAITRIDENNSISRSISRIEEVGDNSYSIPLLCRAIKKNDMKVVRELCNSIDCSKDFYDYIQTSPLHVACHFMRRGAVKLLLSRGADPNCLDYRGYSPLVVTIDQDDFSEEIFKILKLYRAAVDITTIPMQSLLREYIYNSEVSKFELLLNNRKNPNSINFQDYSGRTLFTEALCFGNKIMCNLVLKCNPDLELRNRWGRTAAEEGRMFVKDADSKMKRLSL